MPSFPDFSSQGYRVEKELSRNYLGGRIAYLAKILNSDRQVVIKQFQFATANSDWSGFKAYQREIEVLQQLEHSGIPKYLDCFETEDGFCMVQEYKKAVPLSLSRTYSLAEIKKITIQILQIIIYLQNRIPSVIHRDIKPENILIDEAQNIYLVDFGFARLSNEEMAVSSITVGTIGFMAPEQIYNRTLTEATDLYSLGMTLVCLLTETKSNRVSNLIDEDNLVNFKHLLPQLSQRWIDWLEKMVARNVKDRYKNAKQALNALIPISILSDTKVNLRESSLEFIASKYGEKVTKTIYIENQISETILFDKIDISPACEDSYHRADSNSWIDLNTIQLSDNKVQLEVTVDTSNLRANTRFERQIRLHNSACPEASEAIDLVVYSGSLLESLQIPYLGLYRASIITIAVVVIHLLLNMGWTNAGFSVLWSFIFGLILQVFAGLSRFWNDSINPENEKIISTNFLETQKLDLSGRMGFFGMLATILSWQFFNGLTASIWMPSPTPSTGSVYHITPLTLIFFGIFVVYPMIIIGVRLPILGVKLIKIINQKIAQENITELTKKINTISITMFVLTAGILVNFDLPNHLFLKLFLGAAIFLGITLCYPNLQQIKEFLQYKQKEKNLIES